MAEDRCRVRDGARALSGVRNTVLGIICSSEVAIREGRAEVIHAVTGRIVRMALEREVGGFTSVGSVLLERLE